MKNEENYRSSHRATVAFTSPGHCAAVDDDELPGSQPLLHDSVRRWGPRVTGLDSMVLSFPTTYEPAVEVQVPTARSSTSFASKPRSREPEPDEQAWRQATFGVAEDRAPVIVPVKDRAGCRGTAMPLVRKGLFVGQGHLNRQIPGEPPYRAGGRDRQAQERLFVGGEQADRINGHDGGQQRGFAWPPDTRLPRVTSPAGTAVDQRDHSGELGRELRGGSAAAAASTCAVASVAAIAAPVPG
jgi:hypothetical protein